MFDRILVPLGLDQRHDATAAAIATFSGERNPTVTLLHVIETVENIPFDELEDFYKRLEKKAKKFLNKVEEELSGDNVGVRAAITYGNRVEQILEFAKSEGSDLILMSSHRVEADAPGQGWNSISHTIAIFAPCAVLLLK